ncbi:MAG: tRNA(5-methylaminomethyl-2-thiouridylate) methyltransferase [Desulfohalobiaceae bacterium]
MQNQYDCLALFSGGLDSLLACKLLQIQGLRVLGLHFISPFFGSQETIEHWQKLHGIDLIPVDISQEFIQLLLQGPEHGLGKGLNPCVDCKILMLQKSQGMLEQFQAEFIISGEVLGQRPMSQRKDTLNLILKRSGTKELLLRPLSARNLPPTPVELSGKVDRSRLMDFKGRGRKQQLSLARELQLQEIPTPAGGCLLTEPEAVKRIWPVLKQAPSPQPDDLALSRVGRQYWAGKHWLVIGRNQQDNQQLLDLIRRGDILFKLLDIPGPLAVARQLQGQWSAEAVRSAASFMLRFSSKARQSPQPVRVRAGTPEGHIQEIQVLPQQEDQGLAWREASWQDFQQDKGAGLLPWSRSGCRSEQADLTSASNC